jgi:hypothetical protein
MTQPDTTVARLPSADDGPRTTDHGPTPRWQIYAAAVFACAIGILFLVLPGIYHAHREYLLWSEGFLQRAFGLSFMHAQEQRILDPPNPLWSLFWLLSSRPNQLFLLLGIMVAAVSALLPLISARLTGSIIGGVVAALVLLFGFRSILDSFISGSWALPLLLLDMVFLLALITRRWVVAVAAIGLAGLIRPESWLLAIFLLLYIRKTDRRPGTEDRRNPPVSRDEGRGRERISTFTSTFASLKWYHFLPLLALPAWLIFDYHSTGDWLHTWHSANAYALLSAEPGANFLSYWPRLIGLLTQSTGVVAFIFALAAIVLRGVNIAREAGRGRGKGREKTSTSTSTSTFASVILDPLLAVTLLPVIAGWILSLSGNLVLMRQSFVVTIALLAFYALILPGEVIKCWKLTNRVPIYAVLWAPVLLIALIRLPGVGHEARVDVKVTEAKMAGIDGLAAELLAPGNHLDRYRYILIPYRRYPQFTALVGDSIAGRFLSYRELSLAVAATQQAQAGAPLQSPANSPAFIRNLIRSGKHFADFLPALALWIPDDERNYIDVFSFDDPQYYRHNYVDHQHYAFRIIDAAMDSLGLVYDVRELTPEQLKLLTPIPPPPDTGR